MNDYDKGLLFEIITEGLLMIMFWGGLWMQIGDFEKSFRLIGLVVLVISVVIRERGKKK